MYVLGGLVLLAGLAFLAVRSRASGDGTAGSAQTVGGEFVDITYGYRGEAVTFLVIRNWPSNAGGAERADDDRFDAIGAPPTVRAPDGTRAPVAARPHVYFFDGPRLTQFPIEMTEDELEDDVEMELKRMTDYRDLLPILRRFEVGGG